MYQQKLVCAVKHNGRVLREQGDTVLIPFGSEYSLHFKNLNALRSLVRVSIDGVDATEGTSLIVPANGSIDLERFIKNGNLSNGNRFRFIERTTRIENGPRGIQAEDGLIRVEFEFEQQAAKIETIKRTYVDEYWRRRPYPYYWGEGPWYSSTTDCAFGSTANSFNTSVSDSIGDVSNSKTTTANAASTTLKSSASRGRGTSLGSASLSAASGTAGIPQNAAQAAYFNQVSDAGITVPGSESNQQFQHGAWFPTDGQKHVMVLKLLGQLGEDKVTRPVTVKTRIDCPTCGTSNRSGFKHCRECGTALFPL